MAQACPSLRPHPPQRLDSESVYRALVTHPQPPPGGHQNVLCQGAVPSLGSPVGERSAKVPFCQVHSDQEGLTWLPG